MPESIRFRVNAPHVVHEPFDDDIVLVHLGTGRYYAVPGCGAIIWHHLAAGWSPTETSTVVAALYQHPEAEVAVAIDALVVQLVAEELIVPAPDRARTALEDSTSLVVGSTFVPPSLESYTDMQELLLLDPIHEVDDAGWPIARTPPE